MKKHIISWKKYKWLTASAKVLEAVESS